MDVQILTMCIMAAMALCGVVLAAVVIFGLRSVVQQQALELSKLAMRKPYWIIETNERGIVQISRLETRVGELESRLSAPGTTEQLETQWLPDGDKTAQETPPMNPDDIPVDLGERA